MKQDQYSVPCPLFGPLLMKINDDDARSISVGNYKIKGEQADILMDLSKFFG